jgi:hypothetical protein
MARDPLRRIDGVWILIKEMDQIPLDERIHLHTQALEQIWINAGR